MEEERLGSLEMPSAKKSFLNSFENFDKQGIDTFASKNESRIDFIYLSD